MQEPQDPHTVPPSDPALEASEAKGRQAWQRFGMRLRSVTPAALARFLLVAGMLFIVARLLQVASEVLIPFIVGSVLAYLLLPLVDWFDKYLPRWLAILMVYVLGLVPIILGLSALLPPLVREIGNLPALFPSTTEIRAWLDALTARVEALPPETQQAIEDALATLYLSFRNNFTSLLQGSVAFLINRVLDLLGTLGFLIGFLVIPFWLFYLLRDKEAAATAFDTMLPRWARADVWAILRIVDRIFSSYIRGQLFLGLIIASAVYLGLNLLQWQGVEGIHSELLLAVIAGVLELVPYIGPLLGAVPAVIIGLLTSWESGLAIAILFLVIQQIEGNFLVPRVVGSSVKLHPAAVMLAVIVLTPFGFLYILIAAPLAAAFRDIFLYLYRRLDDSPQDATVPSQASTANASPPQGQPKGNQS